MTHNVLNYLLILLCAEQAKVRAEWTALKGLLLPWLGQMKIKKGGQKPCDTTASCLGLAQEK